MLGTIFTPRFLLAACTALGLVTPSIAVTVNSKILILARDEPSASSVSSGLDGYGIPFQQVLVPQGGITLPQLKDGNGNGNYGGLIVVGSVSYEYDGSWRSALTTDQWNTLYAYQTAFKVRMVRVDEFPGPSFGVATANDIDSSCCADGVEQLVSITNASSFETATLKLNAGMSTQGLWHYPAIVTDKSTTWEAAKFGAGGPFTQATTAGVINNFSGREQFVWFMSWAPEWSATSNFLQHAHIHWMTRGLFAGKRKIHLNTQVDDVQIGSTLYLPEDVEFKTRVGDLAAHVAWQKDINQRLPSGSSFWLEFAHNGNGNIIGAIGMPASSSLCKPRDPVRYDQLPATPLEWVKPIGTGTDVWPDSFNQYTWSKACAQLDEYAAWFLNQDNLNAFAHVSHTFTHLSLNNATYRDAAREVQFNQAWATQMGIDKAKRWSPKGLVPPAITGLHNGDAIRAWMESGLTYVVGDNTRPPLRNTKSRFWPLISTVADNGYAGLYIIPRYSTTIYYNCDSIECTVQEWIETSAGSGNFSTLLDDARRTNTRYLLSLQADPYMFHQANLRQIDMEVITVGSETGKMSLVMAWVETIVQEMSRLTDWPIRSLKHDDIAQYFINRMTLDACSPQMSYTIDGQSVTAVTVTTKGNTCSVPVPVTIPAGSASAVGGTRTMDVVGNEPPIVWVTMTGLPVTLRLTTPVIL